MSFQAAKSISIPVDSNNVITQYDAVYIDTDGNAAEVTDGSAAAQVSVGVALEGSASGDTAAIPVAVYDGAVLEANAGAAISIGDRVFVGDDGKFYPQDSATAGNTPAGTYNLVGVALNAPGGAGQRLTFVSGYFGTVTLA